MKKKLLLINCLDLHTYPDKENYNQLPVITAYEPIHLGIIAALTPSDWEIVLIDENFEQFNYIPADLVAISSYTTSINRAYSISALYREKNIPVVLGGIHATFFPEEAMQYAQTVAVGKAEGLWPEIISDFNDGNLKPVYYSNENLRLCFTPDRNIYKKYKYPIATVIASMGCPHRCSFCDIPIANKEYYLRDTDEIIDDLKRVHQEFFIFNDDNFIGNTTAHKDRIKELLEKIIASGIRKKWMCVTSIIISSYDDILVLAKKAGCVMMFIGIESFKKEELNKFNKNFINKYCDNYYGKAFDAIHKRKIAITGGFFCGMDEDTIDDIENKKNDIIRSKVDSFTYTFYTPLPKTKIYEYYLSQNRLLYTAYPVDWIYHNLSCVIFKTALDSYNAYFRAYMKAVIDLHSYRVFFKKFVSLIFRIRSLRRTIDAFFILKNFHNNIDKYKFFRILFKYVKYKY